MVQLVNPMKKIFVTARRVIGSYAMNMDAFEYLFGRRAGKIACDHMHFHSWQLRQFP